MIVPLLLTGCFSGTIHPPASPTNPVTVYIPDYGKHSAVVLPDPATGGYIEWAFGDWNYFALGHTGLKDALSALFVSPQSTLGRRVIPPQSDDDAMKQTLEANGLLRITISADRSASLMKELNDRYQKNIDSMIHSTYSHMDNVKDAEHYWGLHNCNHLTAQWLRELGCKVDGLCIWSNFKLGNTD
ncbi:MAG TPA: DUF2459 domain-containing protein [Tepidisphaeraceae bacterium]|nr:DUF2459 domain-containing protein [Tepidisphaeraceae bacterium]